MVNGFCCCHGWFSFGYDWVVVGGAKNFYEPYFGITTPTMKGWATSSALIGCVFGALLCFALSDKFGRRRLLILSGFLFALAAIGTAMAGSFMFIISSVLWRFWNWYYLKSVPYVYF